MPFKLPYPIPHGFDREAMFRNPGQTIPAPNAGDLPVPCWFASPTNVYWTFPAAFPNGYSTWRSPIFDLRPNLRGFTSNGFSGNNNTTQRGTPVWVGGGSGGGGKLFIQISNLTGTLTGMNNLEVLVQESGHIANPGKVTTLTPLEDITTSVNSTTNSVILSFLPMGEGYPIRYWQLSIFFQKRAAGGTTDPFQIEAAYY
jgi:hypothetical protein